MKHTIFNLEELIAPLSKGKVMLVVECVNYRVCEQPSIMNDVLEILEFDLVSGCTVWENFLDNGFLVFESECEESAIVAANSIVDILRSDAYWEAVQAILLVNGVPIANSWDGTQSSSDIVESLPNPAKSVVLRFPIEKINNPRNLETEK